MIYPSEEARLLDRIVDLINDARIGRSCLSCHHFDEPSEGCALAGGGRPPARTIATGCPAWLSRPPF